MISQEKNEDLIQKKYRVTTNINSNKRAISPVIATALLIVVAVVAVIGFQNWFGSYSSGILTKTEIQSKDSIGSTKIDTILGDTLYFKIGGTSNITITSFKVDGNNCQINQNVSNGLSTIILGNNCTQNLSTSKAEIVVYTNNGIYSQYYYNTGAVSFTTVTFSSCTLDNITINHNENYTFYNSSIVPFGSLCSSEIRVCNDGVYSGNTSFNLSSCSVTGQDINPTAFSFNNQTGVTLSTLIYSNTIIPTGYDGPLSVGVTGDGTPKLRVNNGSWVTSTTMNPTDNLTIQLNSSSNYLNTSIATLTLGNYSTNWGVSTNLFRESCYDILIQTPNSSNGTYWIDPDGSGGLVNPFQVYCDMTTDGGGWTLYSTGKILNGGVGNFIVPTLTNITDPNSNLNDSLLNNSGSALLNTINSTNVVRYITDLGEKIFYRESSPKYFEFDYSGNYGEMSGGYAGGNAIVPVGNAYCSTTYSAVISNTMVGPMTIGQITCGAPTYATNHVAGGNGYCDSGCPSCWMFMTDSSQFHPNSAPCSFNGNVIQRWMK